MLSLYMYHGIVRATFAPVNWRKQSDSDMGKKNRFYYNITSGDLAKAIGLRHGIQSRNTFKNFIKHEKNRRRRERNGRL
jgi:hypothetical protein